MVREGACLGPSSCTLALKARGTQMFNISANARPNEMLSDTGSGLFLLLDALRRDWSELVLECSSLPFSCLSTNHLTFVRDVSSSCCCMSRVWSSHSSCEGGKDSCSSSSSGVACSWLRRLSSSKNH